MKIITQSIKDCLEVQLNKGIEDITDKELENIKILNLNRIDINKILNVYYDELSYFKNLEELNISNCMINNNLMQNIKKLKNLKNLNIYNSDFIDECYIFLTNLNIENLVIDNCLGIKDIAFNNLNKLILKNTNEDIYAKNITSLDISNINNSDNNFYLENIKELIISKKNKNIVNIINVDKIIVIDERLDIIEVIQHD